MSCSPFVWWLEQTENNCRSSSGQGKCRVSQASTCKLYPHPPLPTTMWIKWCAKKKIGSGLLSQVQNVAHAGGSIRSMAMELTSSILSQSFMINEVHHWGTLSTQIMQLGLKNSFPAGKAKVVLWMGHWFSCLIVLPLEGITCPCWRFGLFFNLV